MAATRVTDREMTTDMTRCHICLDMIVQPFTVQCGHDFCYCCLYQWFNSNRSCPECRAESVLDPSPAGFNIFIELVEDIPAPVCLCKDEDESDKMATRDNETENALDNEEDEEDHDYKNYPSPFRS